MFGSVISLSLCWGWLPSLCCAQLENVSGVEEGSGSFRVPNRKKMAPVKDGRAGGGGEHILCASVFQKQEGLELPHKWPLTDEMTQVCLGASVGGFFNSNVLSHGNFMSQSPGKVRHQDSTSAPNGRLQKVSAAEQRLLHPALCWSCCIRAESFSQVLPKGILYSVFNRSWNGCCRQWHYFFFLVLGLVSIPDYPFHKRQREFNLLSLLTRPEVIHLLPQIQDECHKAAVLSLFNTTITKVVSLEEFEEIQTQTFTQVSRGVRDEHMEQAAVLSVCIRQMQQLQIDLLETDELSKETSCLGQGGICMCLSNLLGYGENGLKESKCPS